MIVDEAATELHSQLVELVEELWSVRAHVRSAPAVVSRAVPPARLSSARNLEHYVAMRGLDLRPLQQRLAEQGLSSLGRAEANVLAAIEATLRAGCALAGREGAPDGDLQGAPTIGHGRAMLERHAEALLGPAPPTRRARIMVTLPSEAADDPNLVRCLVAEGIDLVRVNGAHDDASAILRMVDLVRAAAAEVGRDVRVMLDLPGPKLRTGPMPDPAPVVKVRPRRDAWGRVLAPGRCRLVAPGAVPPGDDGVGIGVDRDAGMRPGDVLDLIDTRGARRRIQVVSTGEGWVDVELPRTTYLAPGTELHRGPGDGMVVVSVPRKAGRIELTAGDRVVLHAGDEPAEPVPGGWRIGCSLPEALDAVRAGHRVLFDDGRIGGRVERAGGLEAEIVVTHPVGHHARLRGAKGINLPDSDLDLPALTADDLHLLDTVAGSVDLVALSFVHHPQDVVELRRALEERQLYRLGVVLKIETLQGFHSLPLLMGQVMAWPLAGVMIARGDLAVEVGYERLAEVQEEILWLSEAAHLPVIWATEVLDRLAQTGSPTRAEISDAALADRAECVMLNKGPHIVQAIATLHDILGRMDAHLAKKQSLLRRLGAWS